MLTRLLFLIPGVLIFWSGVLYAQLPTPQNEPLPRIDGRTTDIVGSIADTNLDRLTRDRIEKGLLRPKEGIEDIFLTIGSETILELDRFGETCLTAYPGGIITSTDPARRPGDPPRPRTIKALNQVGTAQLVVVSDPSGAGRCGEGQGDLLKIYRFTVTTVDIFKALQELKALIGNVEGLIIRVVGDRIVLDGKIVIPSELERLQKVITGFNQTRPDNAQVPLLNLIELSPLSYQLIAEKMEEAIAGGPDRPRDITVKVVNGRFFLEGSVDQRSQRQEAERICQTYLQDRPAPQVEGVAKVDPTLVPQCNSTIWIRQGQPRDPDPIITVRVDFVTLNRDYTKEFLFSWRPGLATTGNLNYESDPGRFTASFIATVRNLFPVLRNAASHGYGRVLRSATLQLVDRPGENPTPSRISETFKIPYQGVSAEGIPVTQEQEVRTEVAVTAQSIAGSDKINMGVNVLLSQVLGASTTGLANTLENAVNTSLVVGNNESAALGGMLGEQRQVTFDRSPAAQGADSQNGNFELFGVGRSHNMSDSKSQFIVFVTPTKMRSPEQSTRELKRKFRLRDQ